MEIAVITAPIPPPLDIGMGAWLAVVAVVAALVPLCLVAYRALGTRLRGVAQAQIRMSNERTEIGLSALTAGKPLR